MAYSLPELDYPYNALEPVIDEETMKIHHRGHHKIYVDKLNQALQKSHEFEDTPLEELLASVKNLPIDIQKDIRNNGGGHYNHSMFWKILTPIKQDPSKNLITAIESSFDSFENFKEKFSEVAVKHFGSGYAWLSTDTSGHLFIESLPNQDTPLELGRCPIFLLDLWEHAYYLKYQYKRADFIQEFWRIVHWSEVENRLNAFRLKIEKGRPIEDVSV